MTRCTFISASTVLLAGACGGGPASNRCTDPQMLDDLEDGDRFICESGGRHGAWYVLDDGTSTNISPQGEFTPELIPGGRRDSRHAAHLTGFGFIDWGAAMGFSLNGDAAMAQPHDASAAGGIKFWMKSNVPVAVGFPIPTTIPPARAAGACADTAAGEWNCNNHFQFKITAPTPGEWAEYQVPFSAAEQPHTLGSDGVTRAGTATWDPSQIVNVQFDVPFGETFDVWIDDVRFYSCAGAACVPTCADPGLPVACPATTVAPASCRPVGTVCAKTLTADLPGAWGTGPADVWFVGYAGTILHWDGTTFASVPSGTTEFLSVPWGNGPDDVWAVGTNGTIVHWDGVAWSPVPSGTTEVLFGVWSSGPSDAWAVGAAGTILHWDGSAWSSVPSGSSHSLWRVWGSGRDDVWAAGHSTTATTGVIVHWNGTAWSLVTDPVPVGAIGVGGSGSDDVWVSGAGSVVHWNGSAWTDVPSGTTEQLGGVWVIDPSDAWMVGAHGAIAHWNGIAWSSVPSGTPVDLYSVWASGRDDIWATGEKGTILHWDGAAWAVVPVEVRP